MTSSQSSQEPPLHLNQVNATLGILLTLSTMNSRRHLVLRLFELRTLVKRKITRNFGVKWGKSICFREELHCSPHPSSWSPQEDLEFRDITTLTQIKWD